jgi:hypothetical protein
MKLVTRAVAVVTGETAMIAIRAIATLAVAANQTQKMMLHPVPAAASQMATKAVTAEVAMMTTTALAGSAARHASGGPAAVVIVCAALSVIGSSDAVLAAAARDTGSFGTADRAVSRPSEAATESQSRKLESQPHHSDDDPRFSTASPARDRAKDAKSQSPEKRRVRRGTSECLKTRPPANRFDPARRSDPVCDRYPAP